MKTNLLLLLLVTISVVHAQKKDLDLSTTEISEIEQRGHEKLFSAARMAAVSAASQNFDVKYYRCEWEVDPQVQFITGKVTTHYVMTTAGNSIAFDLADNLAVSAVTQRNVSIPFSQANKTLTINFPSATGIGVKDSVSIVYSGVPSGIDGAFSASTHGSGPTLSSVIWTLSEPYGSKEWWPCKDGLTDKADSIDVYITHPSIYKAASNGLLQSIKPVAGSKNVTHWKHRYPIASYLVCMAVTNYSVLNNSVDIGGDNIAMQTFCYPESTASFQTGAQAALDGITFYSNLFGIYPFKDEKYGHVQFGGGGGMEHQTSSFMTNMGENVVAHELAHQWFGDKITCASWEDIWLNEGFATHLASMYQENKHPANATANRAAVVNFVTSSPGGSVRVDNVSNINRIFDSRLSYYKGSYLLYMLRLILGEAVFQTAINNYLQDPAIKYSFVTTANLKSHLEAASGKDLTYFFDQWYTGQGYPSYMVDWFPVGNKVQVKLSQTTSNLSVSFFQLPVPLMFRNSVTNEQKLVVLNNTSNGQGFIEDLGFTANQVLFDPEVWLITRGNTVTKASGSLPVTFVSFRANCGENGVTLNWETSEETNADKFEVERSVDATHWNVIGSVKATGESKVLSKYVFQDVPLGAKQYYYRIVEIDLDGTKQYTRVLASPCIVLSTENNANNLKVTISPNPVKDRLIFETEGFTAGKFEGSIYNLSGSIVNAGTKSVPVKAKNNVDVTLLPVGLYLLVLKTEDQKPVYTIRFLKE